MLGSKDLTGSGRTRQVGAREETQDFLVQDGWGRGHCPETIAQG